MPIEQTPQSAFRSDIAKERIAPPGELVVTPEQIKLLKIPDEVALSPQNVLSFLAGQSAQLNDIIVKPEIKAVAGDIPPYFHDDSSLIQSQSALSTEEKAALSSAYDQIFSGQGGGATVGTQGVSNQDLDSLDKEIQDYLDEKLKDPAFRNQIAQGGGEGPPLYDPLSGIISNELFKESDEDKKKFQELIAAAHGSPDLINAIMSERYSRSITGKIGNLVEAYKFKVDDMQKLQAQFDLENKKAPASNQEMMKFNMEFYRIQTDTTTVFQQIQQAMTEYERIIEFTNKTNTSINDTLKVMINNMKS